MNLCKHATAGLGRFVKQIEETAPMVRSTPTRKHAPGNGYSRFDGQVLEALLVVSNAIRISTSRFACDFEHPCTCLTDCIHNGANFFPTSSPTSDRFSIGRFVVMRTRRREPHCSGENRFLCKPCHRG